MWMMAHNLILTILRRDEVWYPLYVCVMSGLYNMYNVHHGVLYTVHTILYYSTTINWRYIQSEPKLHLFSTYSDQNYVNRIFKAHDTLKRPKLSTRTTYWDGQQEAFAFYKILFWKMIKKIIIFFLKKSDDDSLRNF